MRLHIGNIIGFVVGEIYTLHPYNKPPKIDEIVDYIKEELSDKTDKLGYVEFGSFRQLGGWLKEILMTNLAFRQLNISKNRWEKGQRDIFDDDDYKSDSDDPQENDFIDLDAVFQNVVYHMQIDVEGSQDCFLCKYAKEYGSMEPSDCDKCKTCNLNPKYKYNREVHPWALLPRDSEEYKELVKSGKVVDPDY